MYILELVSVFVFVVLITFGYKKNNRNVMLLSTAFLFIGLGGFECISDFMVGFNEGYNGA